MLHFQVNHYFLHEGGAQVTGLEAITAQNGWAMAITGAIIVMCGLTILSFIISQLHKFIAIFEKKTNTDVPAREKPAPSFANRAAEVDILNDLAAASRIYQSLTEDGPEKFQLTTLYTLCQKEQLPHPHITIRALRDAGYLLPAEEGIFYWKQSQV